MNNSINSLQKRLLAVILLVTFVFVAIIFRLGYLQIIKGKWLQSKAAAQWYRDLPLSAKRGGIYDASGNVLALSYTTYDVYVKASRVKEPEKVALTLSNMLGLDYDTTYTKVTNKLVSESIIKMQVDSSICEKIIDLDMQGVVLSENSKRYYPYGNMLSQVLGFTTIDNVGQSGIEAYYDKYLQGLDGYALEESDVNGVKIDNTLSQYIPSIAGMDLTLTIDINIQNSLENALIKLMQEQKPKTATGIVMNPNTGEIVAMSTKPSYDLNNLPRDNVETLLQQARNISVVDVYEPGSTFKVLTTATALEQGVATINDNFYDPGYRMVDGEKIKCWKLKGHGSQNLIQGLNNSCNSVFVDLALRLGKEKLYQSFANYGLGTTLGVDFLGEASGILMNKDNAKTVDIARMGFGQAVAVSPLQLISAFCSVVNGGKLMQPYFVSKIGTDTQSIYTKTPTVIKRTVSEKTSETIRMMVEEVVKQYSGFNAFIPGYKVSGKTGTTQKYVDGKIGNSYIASFIGAFPADKPDYVVLIIADEPTGGSYYGSIVATPYAKMVIEDIISYKKYQPSNLEEDLQKLKPTIAMPNVVGLSVEEAMHKISEAKLQCEIEGEGDVIENQLPAPNTMLCENSIVLLKTN